MPVNGETGPARFMGAAATVEDEPTIRMVRKGMSRISKRQAAPSRITSGISVMAPVSQSIDDRCFSFGTSTVRICS